MLRSGAAAAMSHGRVIQIYYAAAAGSHGKVMRIYGAAAYLEFIQARLRISAAAGMSWKD